MVSAVAFLTIVGRGTTPDARTMRWFPAVGLLLGAVVGGVWWLADAAFAPFLAAALAVATDLLLTGMLHVDGLADSADGLLPHVDRDRRLAIMAQPDIGAFGVTAIGIALLLRVGALASMPVDIGLVAGLWCASRSAMALVATTRPYARAGGGLASAFLGDRSTPAIAAAGVVAGGVVAAASTGRAGAAAALALVAAVAAVVALADRRLGGFTGDVLGAVGVVGETVGLVVAAAKW